MQHYRVIRRLARGDKTDILLGESVGGEGFQKAIVLERVRREFAHDAAVLLQFVADAHVARHLHHQSIVSVTDLGRGPDGLFRVMELVDGWSLEQLLDCARRHATVFPPHHAAWVVRQVNEALTHAYSRRVRGDPVVPAHGDVRDANILLSRDGEVKLTGFRAPRATRQPAGTQSPTPPYRSPADDQRALGTVFVQLLTAENTSGAPRLASVPKDLRLIVERMLAAAPDEQWPTTELTSVLGRYLAQAGAPAGASELAQFLTTLQPPPAPLELQTGPSEDTTGSFSLRAARSARRRTPATTCTRIATSRSSSSSRDTSPGEGRSAARRTSG